MFFAWTATPLGVAQHSLNPRVSTFSFRQPPWFYHKPHHYRNKRCKQDDYFRVVGSGAPDTLHSMQRAIEHHVQLRCFHLLLWGHVLILGLMKQRPRERTPERTWSTYADDAEEKSNDNIEYLADINDSMYTK